MPNFVSSTSPRVQLLDSHTVNQIAAGEVVERPASVVKELVENALDAGATTIDVLIEESGRERIRVRDNGCGMSKEDLLMSLQRHATSKITRFEDLSQATTLGFRGEAVPSIGSVSRMTITTGEDGSLRHSVTVYGGEIGPISATAGPRGTEVLVEELFFNTPARLKFMKSDSTEMSQALEAVQRLAMVHPGVRFSFSNGKTVLLQTDGSGELLPVIAEIWGRDVARTLAELDHYENGVRVRGFISPPHLTKSTRQYQWFFVNGRPIRSRQLQTALDIAYRSLTPDKRFPLAAMHIDVDPARVDANVSPTKNEVKFQHERDVFDALRHAVKVALLQQGMVPDAAGLARANEALRQVQGVSPTFDFPMSSSPGSPSMGLVDAAILAQSPLFAHSQLTSTPAPPVDGQNEYQKLLSGLRVVGQIMNTFILAENDEGLLIVDQHVAHERILYERLVRDRGMGLVESQTLLAPEPLTLERRVIALLSDKLDEIRSLGFVLEPFGDDTLLVRAVPAAIKNKNPVGVLRGVIEELVDGDASGCVMPARDSILIMCSCKMAVKAGDPMSLPEMEKLLVDLAETENPYLCPHGRPITIVLNKGELLRKFKR